MSIFALSIRSRSVNDRRAALRRVYNDQAWLQVGGSLVRECRVLNLSRTGACLAITNADRIPETFTLILSKGSLGRPRAREVAA